MNDERYERSADMRLLEMQREALGRPPHVFGSTQYTDPDLNLELEVEDETVEQTGTLLVASIDATPRTGLIPGALITVSMWASNDGDTVAQDVCLSLPLPATTTYRPGTLILDGNAEPDARANDLFYDGAGIGAIEPGARRTLVLKLAVEAGLGDIILSPHLSAASGAILGLRAIRLRRADAQPGMARTPVERPFYESDDDEHAVEPLDERPPQSTIAVLDTVELPPVERRPADVAPVKNSPAKHRPVERAAAAAASRPPRAVAAAPPPTAAAAAPAAAASSPVRTEPPSPAVRPQSSAPVPLETVAAAVANDGSALDAISIALAADVPAARGKERAAKTGSKTAKVPVTKSKPEPKSRAKAKTRAADNAPITEEIVRAPRPVAPIATAPVVPLPRDGVAVAAQGGPILTVRLERNRLSTLCRLFAGPSFGMVAHYLVLNALAATDPLSTDLPDTSLATFVASQEQLLSRALIAIRLGKTPAPDSVTAVLPAFPPALTPRRGRVTVAQPSGAGDALLVRSFAASEIEFLARMVGGASAPSFLGAAQLFVGLCANAAVVADEEAAKRVRQALTAYAALATAEISRIYLRSKLSRKPLLFGATEPTFDDAARTVLETLGALV